MLRFCGLPKNCPQYCPQSQNALFLPFASPKGFFFRAGGESFSFSLLCWTMSTPLPCSSPVFISAFLAANGGTYKTKPFCFPSEARFIGALRLFFNKLHKIRSRARIARQKIDFFGAFLSHQKSKFWYAILNKIKRPALKSAKRFFNTTKSAGTALLYFYPVSHYLLTRYCYPTGKHVHCLPFGKYPVSSQYRHFQFGRNSSSLKFISTRSCRRSACNAIFLPRNAATFSTS